MKTRDRKRPAGHTLACVWFGMHAEACGDPAERLATVERERDEALALLRAVACALDHSTDGPTWMERMTAAASRVVDERDVAMACRHQAEVGVKVRDDIIEAIAIQCDGVAPARESCPVVERVRWLREEVGLRGDALADARRGT